jgi:hypothetical protein
MSASSVIGRTMAMRQASPAAHALAHQVAA